MHHALWWRQQAEPPKIQALQMEEEEEGDMVQNPGMGVGEAVAAAGPHHLGVVEDEMFQGNLRATAGYQASPVDFPCPYHIHGSLGPQS
ncbi:hypothetical protein lerEdw1_005502 [Lerista edwardsae]|nr:hypothetical protein lerEdw1_005502 [Lerista edwardsae]